MAAARLVKTTLGSANSNTVLNLKEKKEKKSLDLQERKKNHQKLALTFTEFKTRML